MLSAEATQARVKRTLSGRPGCSDSCASCPCLRTSYTVVCGQQKPARQVGKRALQCPPVRLIGQLIYSVRIIRYIFCSTRNERLSPLGRESLMEGQFSQNSSFMQPCSS